MLLNSLPGRQWHPCFSRNGVVLASSAPTFSSRPESLQFSRKTFEDLLVRVQESICDKLAAVDGSGKEFCNDRWLRGEDPSAGYGVTRVLENGNLMEKAAANISIIHGHLSETRAKAMSARGRDVEAGAQYFAGALSLVFHPCNPYLPTFRADVRYFEVGQMGWFGGGADLTPNYLDADDACYFHGYLKHLCDDYDPSFYTHSKALCDSYFYIPARKEHRGIGGIFFDDLESFSRERSAHVGQSEKAIIKDAKYNRLKVFEFISRLAEGFLPSYMPVIEKNRNRSYGDRERQWQLLRRGRYLEFNLLYDRGVKFGLDGGRIESIMVSAPPLIAWKYNVRPEAGSPEAEMIQVLQQPRSWT